jgi:hypothetical protein
MAAANLNFPPRPNDQVVSVNTCSPFDGAAIYTIQVRGGNR